MGLFLNFGAGPNQLPEPWQNLDPSHDIRKPLRFDSDSAQGILAEHVIEHVPFLQGVGFFRECLRVLVTGGVLRIAFPDVGRFLRPSSTDLLELQLNDAADSYVQALDERPENWLRHHAYDKRSALVQMLTGWGHQMAWTEDSAGGALLALGFSSVRWCEYGHGTLAGVDGHHHTVGSKLAKLEATTLEATK
jgi:predicted SAM-dependent methyltransferase